MVMSTDQLAARPRLSAVGMQEPACVVLVDSKSSQQACCFSSRGMWTARALFSRLLRVVHTRVPRDRIVQSLFIDVGALYEEFRQTAQTLQSHLSHQLPLVLRSRVQPSYCSPRLST